MLLALCQQAVRSLAVKILNGDGVFRSIFSYMWSNTRWLSLVKLAGLFSVCLADIVKHSQIHAAVANPIGLL